LAPTKNRRRAHQQAAAPSPTSQQEHENPPTNRRTRTGKKGGKKKRKKTEPNHILTPYALPPLLKFNLYSRSTIYCFKMLKTTFKGQPKGESEWVRMDFFLDEID
jgi:hypothetical protein